jgi:hypothetical protein
MARSKSYAWLEITSDTEAVAEARRLALASTDSRVRQLMESPERFRCDDINRVVKANASQLLSAWRTLVSSPNEPFERRLVAAKFLCDRRDDGGLAFLMETVRSGEKRERRQALSQLHSTVCDDAPWMRRKAQGLVGELLMFFEPTHDDVIPMVAHMCKELEAEGAPERAIALWETPISTWARHALSTDLIPREAKTEGKVDAIEAALSNARLSKFDLSQGLQCATAFLDSLDPNVVGRCLELIQKYFPWKKKELIADGSGASSEWYPVIQETGTRAGRTGIPLLEEFLRSKLNSGYRGYALKALSDVLGQEVLSYVDESADELRLAPAIADALGRAFMGTGNSHVISRLQKLASRTRDEFALHQIKNAIKRIGRTVVRKATRKQVAKSLPHPTQGPGALVEHTAITLTFSRLAAIGLITPFSPEEMQLVKATEEREHDDPAWSLLVLDHARIRTCFDTESSDIPPRYDRLIWDFAENSRGIFSPEAVLQKEERRRHKSIAVQFVFRDHLYRFQVRDNGDHFDVERIVVAMNKALANSGLRERFMSRHTGDQLADFIFGDPHLIAEAAQEFEWTLDDAFNSVTV